MADRLRKRIGKMRGEEKHAPEAIFDGISRARVIRWKPEGRGGVWGSTKSGSSLIEPEDPRMTYCILNRPINPIEMREAYSQQCQR